MLCVRDKIRTPRKHLAHGTDQSGDMLDAVHDPVILLGEYNIAVFAHQLDVQIFPAEIAHFIEMFQVHADHSLQPHLRDGNNPAVVQMFAKNHTECRCGHRRGLVLLKQIHQWETGIDGDHQTIL